MELISDQAPQRRLRSPSGQRKGKERVIAYGLLFAAIAVEVVATLLLKTADGFTKLLPSLFVLIGYGLSFFLLSLVLRRGMDVAIVYAIWSATGIVAIAIVGATLLGERLTTVQVLGIGLIISGVTTLELGAHDHG